VLFDIAFANLHRHPITEIADYALEWTTSQARAESASLAAAAAGDE
jgi:hypothetical protein